MNSKVRKYRTCGTYMNNDYVALKLKHRTNRIQRKHKMEKADLYKLLLNKIIITLN